MLFYLFRFKFHTLIILHLPYPEKVITFQQDKSNSSLLYLGLKKIIREDCVPYVSLFILKLPLSTRKTNFTRIHDKLKSLGLHCFVPKNAFTVLKIR